MVTWSASKEEQSMIRERKNEKKRGEKLGKRENGKKLVLKIFCDRWALKGAKLFT